MSSQNRKRLKLVNATKGVDLLESEKHHPTIELEPLSIQTLPDEVWFHIYSFLHRHHDLKLLVQVENNPLAVGKLFSLMATVSQKENRRLYRYVRQVPQDFKYSYYELATFAWACQKKIKLGGVVSFNSIGRLSLNLYMYMIKSCNISDMHTLTLNLQHISSHVSHHFRKTAMENSIPADVIDTPMSPMDFQRQYATYLMKHNDKRRLPSLKKLHLRIQKNEFYAPFLMCFAQSLEELSLQILQGGELAMPGSYDSDLEEISNAIEKMPKLKKLKICGNLQASFRIKSQCLEEINTIPSVFGFWVDECDCPSLQVFKSWHHFQRNNHDANFGNGVRPLSMIHQDEVNYTSVDDGRNLIDLQVCVGSKPFQGMNVPSSCIVLLTNHG